MYMYTPLCTCQSLMLRPEPNSVGVVVAIGRGNSELDCVRDTFLRLTVSCVWFPIDPDHLCWRRGLIWRREGAPEREQRSLGRVSVEACMFSIIVKSFTTN